jgi:hypothetical protein
VVQAQEGLVVDTEVVELVAPPPPAAAVVMGEEWVVTETAAPRWGRSHGSELAQATMM